MTGFTLGVKPRGTRPLPPVEYQRTNGAWTKSWVWDKTKWPRDADRLPNGNTLIADTNNDRVIEVNETGDESTDGRSANSLNLTSVVNQKTTTDAQKQVTLPFYEKGIIGGVVSEIRFSTPSWFGFVEMGGLVGIVTITLLWIGAEVRYGVIHLQLPVRIKRN